MQVDDPANDLEESIPESFIVENPVFVSNMYCLWLVKHSRVLLKLFTGITSLSGPLHTELVSAKLVADCHNRHSNLLCGDQ